MTFVHMLRKWVVEPRKVLLYLEGFSLINRCWTSTWHEPGGLKKLYSVEKPICVHRTSDFN